MEIGSAKADLGQGERVFELTGGHPALDLVNTLDWRFRASGPEELLQDYSDVVRFTEHTGLMTAADARKHLRSVPEGKAGRIVVAAVRELREAAADLLYSAVEGTSPSAAAVKRLQDCFVAMRQHQKLQWDGEKLEWKLDELASRADAPLLLLGASTAELMTSEQMHLLRECGNAECRWLFIDTSKNHTRRWCDMKICGNRMKARRFKAVHKN